MRVMTFIATIAAILAMGVFAASCGSDSDSDSKSSSSKQGSSESSADESATKVAVEVGERGGKMFVDAPASVVEGPVTFTVENSGAMLHELVVVKTDTAADKLEVVDGRVSEDDSVGEVADIEAGATKSATFDLAPGKYVLLCNIAGHYTSGMYTAFTVTASSSKEEAATDGAAKVDVEVGEKGGKMFMTTSTATAAGPVTFTVENSGAMLHELVILRTDTAGDKLEVVDGRVSEDDSVGEVADIEAGATKSATFDLEPGKYVLVCNIAGHYASGMYTAFTVT